MAARLIRSGKVRDIYDLEDRLLLVASDRISAFDWVFPTPIPDKGRVLTQLSRFWFDQLGIENHLISDELSPAEIPEGLTSDELKGRSMIVRKCEVIPIECVARGHLVGSGWKDYQATGGVCGMELPPGLRLCDALPETLFTPATKVESGHDENIPFDLMSDQLGKEVAETLRRLTMEIYEAGRVHARERGIMIADTKLEWGWHNERLILIDEVLTPDSSRFWPEDQFQPGRNQVSFDKQFVRDYLETTSWDKESEPPELPESIVMQTREKYIEAFERLTESSFAWK